MKNISYVINGVLAVAIIILFVLFFTNKGNSNEEDKTPLAFEPGDSTVTLPIAYVNVDSLLANYEFAKVSGERLMNKFKSSNNTVAQKQRQLETEATDFQRKVQSNAFLSQERAQAESQRIQKLNADLQQMAQRLENELAQEEQKINEQLADSVRVCLVEYNKKANYQIIFSNKGLDNILTAKDKYDITQDILKLLNSRYKAEAAK
ncbi:MULTISPECIES: OmpH family outer membrane protein [unclassified Dysgonomonas]|uniref:OmpH family outer membrane protein n=1 Tax=unclassified Dysgonomonas TaxID=2630389 RepID=UPI0013ED49B8|nr:MULTISPECIES: OmpH family outer membrane protein [unclassified Dysgonomonas]